MSKKRTRNQTTHWRGAERRKKHREKKILQPVPEDAVAALEEIGIDAEYRGSSIVALCPGHKMMIGREDRKSGSWSMDPVTGMHHCWSCSYSGSFVSLVSDVVGLDQKSARIWVLKRGGVIRESTDERPDRYQKPNFSVDEASLVLLSTPPEDWLEDRMISREVAERYEILFDPSEGEWVFPIRSQDGTLLGKQFKGPHGVINDPKRVPKSVSLFGLQQFEKGPPAIIVESPLDVARLASMKVKNPLATWGAEISIGQADILVDHTEAVILALDNDEGGKSGTEAAVRYLCSRVSDLRVVRYRSSDPKDVGEMEDSRVLELLKNAEFPYTEIRKMKKSVYR